jgi:hypothetical protein
MLDRTRLPNPSEYFGQLGGKLVGKSIRLKCPIHGGSGQTLSVDLESGRWQCFSCLSKGGDVLSFHMQHNNVGFIRAATELGAWLADGQPPSANDLRQPSINHKAALTLISLEVVVLAQEASRIRTGQLITDADIQRLLVSAGRIQGVCADLGLYKTKEKND